MQWVAAAGLVPTSARTLAPFKLRQPHSLAQAQAALRDSERPVLLAGGTDLVAAFNEGLQPRELICLAGVPELHQVQPCAQGLRIGAAVNHAQGSTHALLHEQAPGLAQAWAHIANPRIRFTGTLGGNLMARRKRYEGSAMLACAGVQLEFATPQGALELPVLALWQGLPERALLLALRLETASLLGYFHDRSLRPLLGLAGALRQRANGLHLCCAVATEHLAPVLLELNLPGMNVDAVAANAQTLAQEAFAQLPAHFADAAVTPAYARAAGAALLARQLKGLAHE